MVDIFDSAIVRLMQHVKDCFRRVGRIDQTKAGRITQIAECHFAMRAGHASMPADNDVKID